MRDDLEAYAASQAAVRLALAKIGSRIDWAKIDRLAAMEEARGALALAHHAKVPIAEMARLTGFTRPTVYALLGGKSA